MSQSPNPKALGDTKVEEMRRKIHLLKLEAAAFKESSQATIRKNQEAILEMRKTNEVLGRRVAKANAGNKHVVKEAFQSRGVDMKGYHNMSAKEAQMKLEREIFSKKKHLNAEKHITRTLEEHLEKLNIEYHRMKLAHARNKKEKDEDAMNLRELENRLEKTQFKSKVAKNIIADYIKQKSLLQDESLTYQSQLDSLEAELLKGKEELRKCQAVYKEAQLSKEAAKRELQQQEELLYKQHKEQKHVLTNLRQKVKEMDEEGQAHTEKAEKTEEWTQRMTTQPDDVSSEPQRSNTRLTEEDDKVISTVEEAFQRIKEATGITDIHELAEGFASQHETQQRLEKLKKDNEVVLHQLNEKNELLTKEFQDMKYSGEAKLSRAQQQLEERKQKLQAQQQRRDGAKERLDQLHKTHSAVRTGVEHLAAQLQHIPLSDNIVADVSPNSDEYVVELMTQCELKLQVLCEELEGKDLTAVKKEIEKEELYDRNEGRLLTYDTHVELPDMKILELSDKEERNKDEDTDISSREALKRNIKSKSKEKLRKKEKGRF